MAELQKMINGDHSASDDVAIDLDGDTSFADSFKKQDTNPSKWPVEKHNEATTR